MALSNDNASFALFGLSYDEVKRRLDEYARTHKPVETNPGMHVVPNDRNPLGPFVQAEKADGF